MVQNNAGRRRGRPPSYDRDEALARAGDTFWNAGYAATTLDDLGQAMGMNRPSLYGAFGDKHALYVETLGRYSAASNDRLVAYLALDLPLAAQLTTIYDAALAIYLSGDPGPRGCFLIGTALSEAVRDDAIRSRLLDSLQKADALFEDRFRRAVARGELTADADPQALGQVAAAMLNALAVRARAGEDRATLRKTAAAAIGLIAGRRPGDGATPKRARKPAKAR